MSQQQQQKQQKQQVTEVARRVSEARLNEQVQQLLHPISGYKTAEAATYVPFIYVGETKDDKPHGRGISYRQFPDTHRRLRYHGFFENGKMHGYGELQTYDDANGWQVWVIGEFYLGVFVCGYFGFTPDGRRAYGNFADPSMRKMNGRLISPNGSQRVGYFDVNTFLRSYSEHELEVFLERERLDAARLMLFSMGVKF